MRILLIFILPRFIFVFLPRLQDKKNREKINTYLLTDPGLMQFLRPPKIYVVLFGGVILYVLGGFFLVLIGAGLTRWWTTHPQLKKQVYERKELFISKSSGTQTTGVASSSSPGFSPKTTHTPPPSSSSFIPSSSSMETVTWIKKMIYRIIAGIIVLFVLSKGLPWYTVSPGEIALITRFGKLQDRYATEGLNFKVPVIDKVIRINIQTQKVEATANAASKDLQNISATIAVNGSVQAASAKELYRNLGDASLVADKIINPSIQESVKAATAKYTAEELITKRTAVSQDIRILLVEKLERRGIQVSDVNIVNFQFSADFDAAIEKKVKAEQEALAEKNKLESVKFQAQQSIERSKAEAESIRIQAEAIKSQGGQEYVNLKWIEKWDGKLPQTSLGQSNGLILNLKQ